MSLKAGMKAKAKKGPFLGIGGLLLTMVHRDILSILWRMTKVSYDYHLNESIGSSLNLMGSHLTIS